MELGARASRSTKTRPAACLLPRSERPGPGGSAGSAGTLGRCGFASPRPRADSVPGRRGHHMPAGITCPPRLAASPRRRASGSVSRARRATVATSAAAARRDAHLPEASRPAHLFYGISSNDPTRQGVPPRRGAAVRSHRACCASRRSGVHAEEVSGPSRPKPPCALGSGPRGQRPRARTRRTSRAGPLGVPARAYRYGACTSAGTTQTTPPLGAEDRVLPPDHFRAAQPSGPTLRVWPALRHRCACLHRSSVSPEKGVAAGSRR